MAKLAPWEADCWLGLARRLLSCSPAASLAYPSCLTLHPALLLRLTRARVSDPELPMQMRATRRSRCPDPVVLLLLLEPWTDARSRLDALCSTASFCQYHLMSASVTYVCHHRLEAVSLCRHPYLVARGFPIMTVPAPECAHRCRLAVMVIYRRWCTSLAPPSPLEISRLPLLCSLQSQVGSLRCISGFRVPSLALSLLCCAPILKIGARSPPDTCHESHKASSLVCLCRGNAVTLIQQ